jgi:hypothetical protein
MFDEEFNEEENDERPDCQHHIMNSVEGLRDEVLRLFGAFLSRVMDDPDAEQIVEHHKQFLEVWEVEGILKELSDVKEDGLYGIGANSLAEYQEKMGNLFRALATRIVSNIMQLGVQGGLLDSEYDFEKGSFDFSVTEKGLAYIAGTTPPTAENN